MPSVSCAAMGGRFGASRYTIRSSGARGPSAANWPFRSLLAMGQKSPTAGTNSVRLRGRHLVDHEALACLLVLLFVDEPRLNTSRLHRVLRNLCYHGPTRHWLLRALLSILQRTGECRPTEVESRPRKRSAGQAMELPATSTPRLAASEQSSRSVTPSWLSVSLDAALGCRANVFQIHRSAERGKKHGGSAAPSALVSIHPKAAPVVCRHVLDTLISLAKSFPNQFLPKGKAKEAACEEESSEEQSPPKGTPARPPRQPTETDFWDLLVRLDSLGNKRGKSIPKAHPTSSSDSEALALTFEDSALGQLMAMLSHPVVRRSQLLTDRLLRLLGLVSSGLPDGNQTTSTATSSSSTAVTTTAAAGELPLSITLPMIRTLLITGLSF